MPPFRCPAQSDVAAMAALKWHAAGGKRLVLLMPPFAVSTRADGTLRWSDRLTLSIPLTVLRCCSLSPIRRCCSGGGRTGHVSPGRPRPTGVTLDGRPQAEQAALFLEQLIRLPPGNLRQRRRSVDGGKPALASFCASLGEAIVTAPNA